MFYLFFQVKCVVVGFDINFTFQKLARATSYLSDKDCMYVVTNTDAAFPAGGKLGPGK